ncbi:hypothetical protein D9M72_321090 [compost metagenome]
MRKRRLQKRVSFIVAKFVVDRTERIQAFVARTADTARIIESKTFVFCKLMQYIHCRKQFQVIIGMAIIGFSRKSIGLRSF